MTASDQRVGSRRTALLALVMPITLLAGLTILLFHPVPAQSPDRIEHYQSAKPLPPLLPGTVIDQELRPTMGGVVRISARFGTYKGAEDCRIHVTARRQGGSPISRRTLGCASLEDNALTEVAVVPADAIEPGDALTVTFAADPDATEAVALWGGATKTAPKAEMAGEELAASVELYTRYGEPGRLIDRLGSVLSRAQQYRAWWGAPPVVAVLAIAVVGGLVGLAVVRGRWRMPLLLVVVAAKGVLWSVLLPPLETPDEPAHVAYAQFMAEERRVPDRYEQRGGFPAYSDQLRSATRVVHQWFERPGDRPDFGPGPEGPDERVPDRESRRSGGGGNPAAGYAPPYFVGAAIAYALPPDAFFTSLSTMRLWSVALGVVAVWLVVGIGRRALRDETAALALGVAVGFHPVWTQATAGVNNDAAAAVAGAACTLVALDLALQPERRRLPLIAGLVFGGALLTKPFLAAFAAPLGLAWLIGRRASREVGASWLRDVRDAVIGVACTFGLWMLVSRVLGIPVVTTDDHGIAAGTRTIRQYVHGLTADGYHTLHLNWVDRLWGNLSWTDTPAPPVVNSILARATLVALGLAVVWLLLTARDVLRHRRTAWTMARRGDAIAAAVFGSAVLSALVLLHLIELRFFLRTGRADLIAGRYLVMTVPAILGLLALLVQRVASRVPVAATMSVLAAGVMALHVVAIDVILDHFYL